MAESTPIETLRQLVRDVEGEALEHDEPQLMTSVRESVLAAARLALERLEAVVAELRGVQWLWLVDESDDPDAPVVVEHCLRCGLSRSAGHADDCQLRAALVPFGKEGP